MEKDVQFNEVHDISPNNLPNTKPSPHASSIDPPPHTLPPAAVAATTPTTDPLPNNADYGARPPCFNSTLQETFFVITCTFATAMSSVFGGSTLCMTNAIGTDLHMNAAQVTWLWAAQNLASGALLLLFGRMADLFGRRMLLILSMASFTVFTVAAGFATNAVYIDVFSGLIGISCAASVPPAIGKLGAVYEKPSVRKNRAFACFSAGYPVGFVIGALMSGVATQVGSWRVTFWVMGVIYAIFSVIAWFTVPADSEQRLGGWNRETLRKFDFLGAGLAVVGLAAFTGALTLAGGAKSGWRTAYVPGLLVGGVVVLAGFVYWQTVCEYPLMPLGMWRDRNFTLLVSVLCLGFYGFTGNLLWVTLVWQRIERDSPLMVAVKLLPAAIGGICVNVIAAFIMHRVSNKLIMLVAAVSMLVASALWSALSGSLSYWALSFPALIFSVVGCDFQFNVTNMYVMSSLPSDQQSIAGGLFNTVSRLAVTVGLGVQTSVFNAAGGAAEGPGSLLYRPYQATVWVSLAGAVLGVALVPFINLGTQGARKTSKA